MARCPALSRLCHEDCREVSGQMTSANDDTVVLMKRCMIRAVIALLAAVVLLYAADFVVLKVRIATGRNPYGTVTVRSYYSIAKKNNKVEYDYIGTEDETCTHSLFPQGGHNPCWYASSHTERKIEI